MMIFRLRLIPALVLLCGFASFRSAAAQCAASDPVGKYTGSATSGQAGPLDITLNLLCDKASYAGSLNTPMGVYAVTAGSFQAGVLKLELILGDSRVSIQLKRSGDDFEGTFSTGDDSGPVKLHRTGDALTAAPRA